LLTRPKPSPDLANAQGHLDFGTPDFSADAYVADAQNARARMALDTWQTWPGGVFCLFGEAGAGKSHLGSMWANIAEAPIIMGADFDLAALSTVKSNKVLIDRADLSDETALFSLLTSIESQGGAALLIARNPPLLWPYQLPDLKSRLGAIACESLKTPETDLLAKLIIRQSAARGFKIDEAASTYLASRIPRTFEATRVIVTYMESVTRASLKSPMALAQRALQALYKSGELDEEATTQDLFET
jgi:chromosomal replication initiation ATPase DnaA